MRVIIRKFDYIKNWIAYLQDSELFKAVVHSPKGAKLLQSCLTLFDLMDDSRPGSSINGILQARILEWVAISSSSGSS